MFVFRFIYKKNYSGRLYSQNGRICVRTKGKWQKNVPGQEIMDSSFMNFIYSDM